MALEIVRRFVNGAWKTEAAEEGGGGALPQTLTATLVTDPNTFVSPYHVFDLVGPAVYHLSYAFTILAGNGETWGDAPGNIAADLMTLEASSDGVTWVAVTQSGILVNTGTAALGMAILVGQGRELSYLTPRYLRMATTVVNGNTDDPYVGANHPTATAAITVTYV